MNEPRWLSEKTVLAVQTELLAEHGGLPGLRDENVFLSALDRPKNLFAYGEPDIFDLAAAYAFGLAKNHAFVDGNKRIAFTTAFIFLGLNGWQLSASNEDALTKTLALASGEASQDDYAIWLRESSQPRNP